MSRLERLRDGAIRLKQTAELHDQHQTEHGLTQFRSKPRQTEPIEWARRGATPKTAQAAQELRALVRQPPADSSWQASQHGVERRARKAQPDQADHHVR